jgi:hypothetical protein
VAPLETYRPYVEQLFEDSEVQEYLSRSAANLRAAGRQAANAKSKKRAVKDKRLHQRMVAGLRNAIDAGGSLRRASEKQLRRERRRTQGRLVIVAFLAAVAYLAFDARARGRLLDAVGAPDTRPAPEPTSA